MKNVHHNKIAAALLLAVIAAPGMADTETAQVVVSATVVNTCAIGNGTTSFGTRTLSRDTATGTAGALSDIDSASSISIICTKGANATISAEDGANAADAGVRRTKMRAADDPGAAPQAAVKGKYTDAVNLTITYTP